MSNSISVWSPVTLSAVVGGLLVWAAFPPIGAAPLAWLGIAVWVWLCRWPSDFSRRDYVGIFLAALVQWMLVLHWVRLPHWTTWFGWLPLSAYLAVYVPLFVVLLRTALRLGAPLVLATPIVWTGLELIRARFATGFPIALLGHTQVELPQLIQVADLFGAYGVSFLVVVGATAIALLFPRPTMAISGRPASSRFAWSAAICSILFAAGLLALAVAYGRHRLNVAVEPDATTIRVALIQGAIDTDFDVDNTLEMVQEYVTQTQTTLASDGPFDLVVWPESMFAYPWISITQPGPLHVPGDAGRSPEEYRTDTLDWQIASANQARVIVRAMGSPLLAGTTRLEFSNRPVRRFNSALYFDTDGKLLASYDKMHPVLFGEYLPFGKLLPWLYTLTPMRSGVEKGAAPACIDVRGIKLAPHICFENTVPHLLRRQYITLRDQGCEPDALVTITNDGWFWGSSLLDIHLAAAVFRTVELRRPLLIAANTGFSAWINDRGQVLARGPRRATGAVVAKVACANGPNGSVYLRWGDLPVGFCSAVCGYLALVAGAKSASDKRP